MLANPAAFRLAVVDMANPFRREKIDVVAAAEARGFIFAAPVALELNAALVPIRKPGKLPFDTASFSYDLEYGKDTLEIHTDAIAAGAKVLVVDDLLATGGTVEACCRLVEKAGGVVVGCAFLDRTGRSEGRRADRPVQDGEPDQVRVEASRWYPRPLARAASAFGRPLTASTARSP